MCVFFLLLAVIETSLLVATEGNKVEYPHRASPSPPYDVKVLASILKDICRANTTDSKKNLIAFYDTITKKYGTKFADKMSKKMQEKKYNTELVASNRSEGEVILPMASTFYWLCILREIGLNTTPTSIITAFKAEILAEDWAAAAALILGIGADIAEPELLAGEIAFAALFLC